MRLQRWLALCGAGSRRACETLIAEGRVSVNGQTVDRLGVTVDPASDRVAVDGRPALPAEGAGREVWAVYKPVGVTSTLADPHAKRTLLDLLPPALKRPGRLLVPVGRLDRDSEGLMLLTDDGPLAHRLTHPRYHVAKEYEVLVEPAIPTVMFQAWRQGIEVPALEGEGGKVEAPSRGLPTDQADGGEGIAEGGGGEAGEAGDSGRSGGWGSSRETVVLRASARPGGRDAGPDGRPHPRVVITLYEGRKRQIRRMVEAAGSRVVSLRRVRIGPVHLADLAAGEFRPVRGDELERLRAAATLPS